MRPALAIACLLLGACSSPEMPGDERTAEYLKGYNHGWTDARGVFEKGHPTR